MNLEVGNDLSAMEESSDITQPEQLLVRSLRMRMRFTA